MVMSKIYLHPAGTSRALSLTEIDLRAYFEKFGEISYGVNNTFGLCAYGLCGFVKTKFAVIIYKKPEHVASVLNHGHCHLLNGFHLPLIVEKAPNWLQPEFIEDMKPLVDISTSNSNITNNSILRLNDDCLLHLFSFLNLSDQVTLSGLCSRLSAIGEIAFEKAHKN